MPEPAPRLRSRAQPPLLSVITVVRNARATLQQTIESVLGQQQPELEYLILDGGSTDGTIELVERYADRLDYFASAPDRGLYDAMNRGIALARGELVAFLNGDDWYEPGAVAAVLERYRASGRQPGVLYGHTHIVREDMGFRYKAYADPRRLLGMGMTHPAMFVHRDVFRSLGGFDLAYRFAADFDFLVRALGAGVPFVSVDRFLVNYRDGGLSARNLRATLAENREILARRIGRWSGAHLAYSVACAKSAALMRLERVIGRWLGDSALQRARAAYLKARFAREREPLT